MKWLKYAACLAIVALAAFALWKIFTPATEEREFKTQSARIRSIRQMVDLCTADIHEEWAIKDSIHGKWIVVRQTIEGRIRFDLDSLRTETRGDTLLVYLPAERVDIFESASPEAYEVLDSWDGRNHIFERTLTATEENTLKERWNSKARMRVYERGYVKDARANAARSLAPLLNAMRGADGTGAPVIVIDPTPEGNPPATRKKTADPEGKDRLGHIDFMGGHGPR